MMEHSIKVYVFMYIHAVANKAVKIKIVVYSLQ